MILDARWWGQYKIIPWPDSCCLFISTCIQGHDERWGLKIKVDVNKRMKIGKISRGRLMRRTIARYLIVALIQCLRMTSIQVFAQ